MGKKNKKRRALAAKYNRKILSGEASINEVRKMYGLSRIAGLEKKFTKAESGKRRVQDCPYGQFQP